MGSGTPFAPVCGIMPAMKCPRFALLFVSLFLLVLTGCADGPSKVTKKYLETLEGKHDINLVEEICTPEYNKLAMHWDFDFGEMRRRKVDNYSHHTIKGNTATAYVVLDNGAVEEIGLVKLGGKWRISHDPQIMRVIVEAISNQP